MNQTGRSLGAAMKRSETFLDVSEHLIELVAACGIETEDTPYITGATAAAAEIGALLQAAVADDAITLAQLFDEAYQPVPRTNPPQHLTRFVALADKLFPGGAGTRARAEPEGRVLHRGRPQRLCRDPQPQVQPAAARRPRVGQREQPLPPHLNDRTGLASARNQRPFLLQTYRRDMGAGKFVVMKEAAAPIVVGGRHWGGLRLAFHF